jgi:hypothetical protein
VPAETPNDLLLRRDLILHLHQRKPHSQQPFADKEKRNPPDFQSSHLHHAEWSENRPSFADLKTEADHHPMALEPILEEPQLP